MPAPISTNKITVQRVESMSNCNYVLSDENDLFFLSLHNSSPMGWSGELLGQNVFKKNFRSQQLVKVKNGTQTGLPFVALIHTMTKDKTQGAPATKN